VEVKDLTMAEVCVHALPIALFISFSVFGAMILGYILGNHLGMPGGVLIVASFTTAGMIGGILGSLHIVEKVYGV